MDQHPIIPGYLDSVTGYPLSGLIHSDIELSATSLNQEHQLGDKAYAALGFHALEFMLFGEKGGRARSAEDFSPSAAEISAPHSAKRRRTQFISLLATVLVEDIRTLISSWNGDGAYYPEAFATYPIEELNTSLKQVSEVELEAVEQIQRALSDSSTQGIHDNKETLQTRKEIAEQVLDILSQTPEQ